MNVTKSLRDHWLRIDARSLGLFRISMGLVLIGDLFRRWKYVKEFYSNDGILPNHNHLFNLKDTQPVWSVLHAFSSPGEAEAAFCVILFFYLCFLAGFRTRAFHLASLACLVSLGARNILLENAGNYAAIALMAFTAFLPLGSRFSLDALRTSFEARDEKGARALNDRSRPSQEAVDLARAPGWSPTSLAALAVLVQIGVIYLASAIVQHKADTWTSGTALHYALNSERFISAAGVWARGALGPGALAAWTRAFHYAEFAIPVLIFVPFAWRLTRGLAVGLMLFTGLTLGIFFSFGLYGWTLVAAAALLVPGESWDLVEEHPSARRARTVIYDVDCGVCLLVGRLARRLDLRGNLTFQGNDDLEGLNVRKGGKIERGTLPKEVTADLVVQSVVVVDPSGVVHTRARAVSEVIQALPLGWTVAWLLKVPGIVNLFDAIYDAIAARRVRISVALGKEACGIDTPHGDAEEAPPRPLPVPPPSTRLRRNAVGLVRELLAAVVFAAMLSQTTHANDLPWQLPQPRSLAAVASWSRMLARWDILAAPPAEDEVFVADGQTRGGKSVDPFTGKEPEMNPGNMRGTGLGQLWNDYLYRIHLKEWFDFQRSFRDYLAKGGPKWEDQTGDNQMVGLDAYWVKQPIPAPGEARTTEPPKPEKLFTQSRGGRFGQDRTLPLLRPDLLNKR